MRNQAAHVVLAIVVLAIGSLCTAQAPVPVAETKTYHSDALNFDFMYPASFADSRTADHDPPDADSPDASCISVAVELTDMRTGFNLISLKQFDESCLKKKSAPPTALGTAASSFLTDSLSRLGKPVMNSNANYFLAGHNASTVSGMVKLSQAGDGQAIFGAVSCVSSDKGIVCFQFLSNDCPGLTALSASTVKFLGAAASPVIPIGIGTACKK